MRRWSVPSIAVLLLLSACSGPEARTPAEIQLEQMRAMIQQLSETGLQSDDDFDLVAMSRAKRELLQEHWSDLTPQQRYIFMHSRFSNPDEAEDQVDRFLEINGLKKSLTDEVGDFIGARSVVNLLRDNLPGINLVESLGEGGIRTLKHLGVPLPVDLHDER